MDPLGAERSQQFDYGAFIIKTSATVVIAISTGLIALVVGNMVYQRFSDNFVFRSRVSSLESGRNFQLIAFRSAHKQLRSMAHPQVDSQEISGARLDERGGQNPMVPEADMPPTVEQPSTSSGRTGRSRHLNSRFCPCFSPSVSDDDGEDEPIDSTVDARPALNSSPTHASPDIRHSLINMAREFRSRFAQAADTRSQQRGPFRRMNTNVHPAPPSLPAAENGNFHPMVYTSIDFTHVLVPDLQTVLKSSYYWGVMDRYEAEKLLDNKPEGTFLLRDSAQSDYLFSVSFRRYQRTLHARIEHLNNKFSFDIHDTTIFSAPTISELIENYKDPSKCLFFEPLLCTPLHRNFVFPLQSLCRAVISSNCSYESVSQLSLPHRLKAYIREYHYKQPVQLHVYDPQSGEKFTTAPPAAYFRQE